MNRRGSGKIILLLLVAAIVVVIVFVGSGGPGKTNQGTGGIIINYKTEGRTGSDYNLFVCKDGKAGLSQLSKEMYFVHEFDEGDINILNQAFDEIKFFSLSNNYGGSSESIVTISYAKDDTTKTVVDSGSGPAELKDLNEALLDIIKKLETGSGSEGKLTESFCGK